MSSYEYMNLMSDWFMDQYVVIAMKDGILSRVEKIESSEIYNLFLD